MLNCQKQGGKSKVRSVGRENDAQRTENGWSPYLAQTYSIRNSGGGDCIFCILTRPIGNSDALICTVKRKEHEEAEGSFANKKSEFFYQLLNLN